MGDLLDWRALAPDPEPHACGCDLCPHDGALEPIAWPQLTRTTIEHVPAITERFMVVMAARAPIPDGYEGEVLDGPPIMRAAFLRAPVTDQPATGMYFRWQIIKAMDLTGWRLRLLDGTGLSEHHRRVVSIVDAGGVRVGWAMSSSEPVGYGVRALGSAMEYVE